MKNIAIIGHGYVGKAVDHAFNTSQVNKFIVDPIYNSHIGNLKGKKRIDVAFVCVPTPMALDGSIDSSIVEQVVEDLVYFDCMIVIKSTVTPEVVKKLATNINVIYNPEFLTEKNAIEDFINAPMHVIGGDPIMSQKLLNIYVNHSQCKPCPAYLMTAEEASFVKYGINSFLATKVLWFNQFKDLIDDADIKYNVIVNAIGSDPRIGHSHTQVPGPDGKKGFGGACFPKDTKAFSKYADGKFTVLDEVINVNNEYRLQYTLDEREQEQNVRFA
jgi:UDPglucose 6-dehydrogenase